MTPEERQKIKEEYTAAAHGMQAGVAMMMNYDPKSTEPKHLRVGVNSAMSDIGGLVTILIAKGVFTEDEYLVAVRDAMLREKQGYETALSDLLQTKITLI